MLLKVLLGRRYQLNRYEFVASRYHISQLDMFQKKIALD